MIGGFDPSTVADASQIIVFQEKSTGEDLAMFHNTSGVDVPAVGETVQLTELTLPDDGNIDMKELPKYRVSGVNRVFTSVEVEETDERQEINRLVCLVTVTVESIDE